MRLIYATDVHGDFERVKQLLYETVADVYIIAGDLTDISFFTAGTAVRYYGLQTYFHGIRRGRGKAATNLEDFVDELLEDPGLSRDIAEKGTRYRRDTVHARRVLRQNCRLLENVISLKLQGHVFCLAGNHDMDLRNTALRDRDLHLVCREAGPLRIAGYGGAGGTTPGIPERFRLKYQAGDGIGEDNNEMYRFFKETRPHVIVSHQPAYGIHDFVSPMGETGSLALRRYCDDHPVLLCLTGHLHDEWGFEEEGGTIYLNPSHFGKITRARGRISEGGFFYDVDLGEEGVNRVRHRKLADGKIYDLIVHDRKAGRWNQEVVDRGRYGALLEGRNYESGKTAPPPGPGNFLGMDLQGFYAMFQPPRSGEVAAAIEEAARLLEAELPGNMAVDVMAGSQPRESVRPGKGLDLVLYLRCGRAEGLPCSSGKAADCPSFLEASRKVSEILWEKFDFSIVDCIDLHRVERSIRESNYECQVTQRFVSYRSMGRIAGKAVIAPVEDLLASHGEYLREIEGSIRSYFSIFMNTVQHTRSFQKYESRLKAIGITVPEPIARMLRSHLKES
jgi:Icc-related predicted phosphoesterase